MAANTSRANDASINIVIHRKPENIPLPYELRGVVTPEKWDYRIMEINKLCARYTKPIMERIWFIFALITCIVVPAVLNHVIFNAITPKALRDAFDRDNGFSDRPASNRFDGTTRDQIIDYIVKTRWITFGIAVGLSLVLWTPFIIWKRIGTLQARRLTTRWAVEDGSMGAFFIPKWTIRTPGVFSIDGNVNITTPPSAIPTLFHQQAYLPPYILQPGQTAAGVMWAQAQPQQVPYNPYGPPTGAPPGMAMMNGNGSNGSLPNYAPGLMGEGFGRSEDEKKDPFADGPVNEKV